MMMQRTQRKKWIDVISKAVKLMWFLLKSGANPQTRCVPVMALIRYVEKMQNGSA